MQISNDIRVHFIYLGTLFSNEIEYSLYTWARYSVMKIEYSFYTWAR